MPTTLLPLLLSIALAPPTESITYSGQLRQLDRSRNGVAVKEFTLHCWMPGDKTEAFFLVEETRTPLPWAERFGTTTAGDSLLNPQIAIGYAHEERNYVLPLVLPFFPKPELIEPGGSWRQDGVAYETTDDKKIQNRECWEIRATTGTARHHTLYVEKQTGLIVAARQTVFMGQGDKFEVVVEISDSKSLDKAASVGLNKTIQSLLTLQEKLGRTGDRFANLTQEQLKTALSVRDTLQADEPTLKAFVAEIGADLDTRSKRMQRVDDLKKDLVGQPAPEMKLTRLDGTPLPSEMRDGKVTIIHFWTYQEKPLDPPYGQVGYLDFMNSRWEDQNVLVLGVAIDSKFGDPETQRSAIRSVKRLQQFMRFTYEVTYDDGSVLNAFGNPTRLGEELPLWIVISPEGNIIHYRTGYYKVHPREGITELNDVVQQALKKE